MPRPDGVERRTPAGAAVDASFAWLVAVPAVAVALALIVLLGPPLGSVLFPVERGAFWSAAQESVRPEPTEAARYLLALLGAILVPCSVLWAWRRGIRLEASRTLWFALEAIFVAVLVLAVLGGRGHVDFGTSYFGTRTLLVALLVCAGFALVLGRPELTERARALFAHRSTVLRLGVPLVAAGVTAIWLLPAIQLDTTVARAQPATAYDLLFTFDEGLSVVNGHSPLVDYVAQYGSLWPYVSAIPMELFGPSLGAFTITLVTITWIAMMAAYGVIRRVVESPLATLVLFLAFMATSFFIIRGTPIVRYSFADYLGMFPLRYAGPFFVLYLLARHLCGEWPRRPGWIFALAGLAVLNNGDFGIPALGATAVALVAAADVPRDRRWWVERIGEALLGLLVALALVSILTLVRAGDLPHIGHVFSYARLFAVAGFELLPMPWFGLWVAICLTYCTALVVAALMVTRGDGRRIEIGALAWIGIFGLGTGAYYVGRSQKEVLIALFAGWGLAIVLLLAVTVRDLARRGARPSPAQLALFAAFGLMLCSLTQFPAPWQSVHRLQEKSTEIFKKPADAAFIAAHAHPGEPVALLTNLGQEISREAGVDDVTPYSGIVSMPTKTQLTETIERLIEAGGTKIFLRESWETWSNILPALRAAGWTEVAATEPPSRRGRLEEDRIVFLRAPPRLSGP